MPQLLILFVCLWTWMGTSNPHLPEIQAPNIQVSAQNTPSLWDELGDHPLDKGLRQCVDENGGTAGTTQCLLDYYEAWDKALNVVYQKIMATKVFDAESKKQLKTAEINWIKYKEAEYAFIEMQYRDSDGTMYPQIMAAEKVRIVRHRTIVLESYLDAMTAERE